MKHTIFLEYKGSNGSIHAYECRAKDDGSLIARAEIDDCFVPPPSIIEIRFKEGD